MNALHRPGVEGHGHRHAGDRQAVADVALGLGRGQRAQVVARDHALRELLELGPPEQVAQLGLADQDDLQQLALVGLEVGQQAQLLQHLGRQHLRLVDDQHVVLADRVRLEQELVQRVEVVLDGRLAAQRLRCRNAELLADRLQQLDHRELGVEDVRDVGAARDLLEEAAAHGGLAGADLAAEQHEAAAAVHAVQQVRERLAVALAHEQVARVRGDREGLVLQAEEGRVHGSGEYRAAACAGPFTIRRTANRERSTP